VTYGTRSILKVGQPLLLISPPLERLLRFGANTPL
jgi:hypothetical protein